MEEFQEVNEYNRYKIGIESTEYDPSKEVYKNMLYIIAYDIREPKRLRRVAKTCEDYGIRVEYSVFECDFSEEVFREFWRKVKFIIDESEDCLLAYRICGSCVQKIESSGSVVRPGKPLLYFM